MLDAKKLIAGAIAGFVAAALVDLDAWRSGKDPDGGTPGFSWAMALRRYAYGALSGALAALGIGAVATNGAE